MRVEVLSHRVVPRAGSEPPHASFRVRTSDGGQEWFVERRWSHLRALHNELWKAWRQQLLRCASEPPSFRHHTYRLGSKKLGRSLLAAREREMEELLSYFASALLCSLSRRTGPECLRCFLSDEAPPPRLGEPRRAARARGVALPDDADEPRRRVDPPYRGRVSLTRAELQAACDAPTPAELFFTPSAGWPAGAAEHSSRGRDVCCQELLAPAEGAAAAAAAAAEEEAIGELSVEVLEASGLPNLDTFSLTDAFALVIFEGIAARTCTVDDDLDPKWHAEMPRAFRLPIKKTSSTLFLALLDDDGTSTLGALDDDDPIGRVLLQPCNLRPHTAVDAWWPLSHKAVGERPGARGSVRLRLCVTWKAERQLLLQTALVAKEYARPPAGPAFSMRFRSRRELAAADYALHGSSPETRYSWPLLRANLAEAARVLLDLRGLVTPLRQLLFWKRPLHSLTLFLAWQLLTVYPTYVPACFPLTGCLLLNASWRRAADRPALLRPLPFWPLCLALLVPAGRARLLPPLESHGAQRGKRPKRYASTAPWLLRMGARGVGSVVAAPLAVVGVVAGTGVAVAGTGVAALSQVGTQLTATAHGLIGGSDAAADPQQQQQQPPPQGQPPQQPPPPLAQPPPLSRAGSSLSAEHLDDDAALESVAAIWRGVVAISSAVGAAMRSALAMRPPRRMRLRRSTLEAAKNTLSHIDSNAINPLAWVLGPVQNYIGDLLLTTRAVTRLVTWQDSATTTFLYLLLALLTLLLALIPWFTIVPLVTRWGARLLGAALLGPHMHYVGLRLDAIEAEHRAAEATATDGAAAAAAAPSEEADDYLLEMESSRSVPRQPCLPDVRSAWSCSEVE